MFKGLSSSDGRSSAPPTPSYRYINESEHKQQSRSTGDSEADTSSSEGEEIEDNSHGSESCPLCLEDMHYSDSSFKPCPCGYQICRFCWHRIREEENERCPACRRIYQDESSLNSAHFPSGSFNSQLKKNSINHKTKESNQNKIFTNSTHNTHVPKGSIVLSKTRKMVSPGTGIYSVTPGTSENYNIINTAIPSTSTTTGILSTKPPTNSSIVAAILPSKKHLHELRVIQKNLVYVIGISTRITNESVLREHEYFGQFGKILKIVVNKRGGGEELSTSTNQITTSGSAYVTFQRNEDAEKAIFLVDGSVFDGRVLRATYGTTKYCSYFLRGIPCPNPGCMYLHEEGERDNSFTKEALSQGKMHMHSHLLAKGEGDTLRQFGTSMVHLMAPPLTLSSFIEDSEIPLAIIDSHQRQQQQQQPQQPQQPQPQKIENTTNYRENALSFLDRLKRWNSSSSESLLDELSLSPPPLTLDDGNIFNITNPPSFDPFSGIRSPSGLTSMPRLTPPKSFSPIIMRPSQLSSHETTPPPSPTIPIPSSFVLQPQPIQQARNVETLFSSFKASIGTSNTATPNTKLKDSNDIEKQFFHFPQSSVLRGL